MSNLSDLTRQQQILTRLRAAQGAWVDGSELATEVTGGSEGLRRLRELGVDHTIDRRRHPDPSRAIWQYRLVETSGVDQIATGLAAPEPGLPVQRFDRLPKPVIMGEVAVCPRCRARTRKLHYEGLEGARHKDPHSTRQPCLGCNGFGIVPNKGPISMTPPELLR
jgi:hypothetical protein